MAGYFFRKGNVYALIHESALTYAPNPKAFNVKFRIEHTFPFWPKMVFYIPQGRVWVKNRARQGEDGCRERAFNKVKLLCKKKLKRFKPKDPHGFFKCKTTEDLWQSLERFFSTSKDIYAKEYLDIVRDRNPDYGLDSIMHAAQSML